jgi:pantetheine-phosphate adenylyltransferase
MKSNLSILEIYVGEKNINDVLTRWDEPHRKFHTRQHLDNVLCNLQRQKEEVTTDTAWDALILAAFFHDAVYVSGAKDNEEKSAEMLMNMVLDTRGGVQLLAKDIILSTKEIEKKEGIFNIFQKADCWPLIYYPFSDIMEYEDQIFKEFQRFSWKDYQRGRIDFLERAAKVFPENKEMIYQLEDYVVDWSPRVGVYAGSFNPFHKGHLNVLEQSEQIFDKVVVAYGRNTEKEDRAVVFPKTISDRENVVYEGFLSELLKKYEDMGCEVTLIRGLRNEYDLNYEQNLVQYIKDQMEDLRVVFFLCDKQYEHLSSGAIRALKKFSSEASKYVVL